MSTRILITAALAVLVLALALLLLVYKAINSWRRRFEAVSRASYVAVFGELAARGSYPQEVLAAWTGDPVFREALVDFIRLLDGVERDRLLRVARELGIIDEAVRTLVSSSRAKRRISAASLLAEMADPATADVLMEALTDPAAGVRINASAALAKIGEPDLVAPILKSIDDESEWDAARTMDQLASLGSPAVEGLIEYLGDLTERIPKYGRLAVQTLGVIGDLKCEPMVLHALASTDNDMRLAAAGALKRCGTQRSVGPLISALGDADGRVRARAAKSLGAHFDERAVEPLFLCLRDREWWVRKNSAASLVHLPGGIPALQRALRDNDHFARDAAREQLMLLGIPAGSPTETESTSPSGDWITDQLRALETEPEVSNLEGEPAPDEAEAMPQWLREQLAQLEVLAAAGESETPQGAAPDRSWDTFVPSTPRLPEAADDRVPRGGTSSKPSDAAQLRAAALGQLEPGPSDAEVGGRSDGAERDAGPAHELTVRSLRAAGKEGPIATPPAGPIESSQAALPPATALSAVDTPAVDPLDEALAAHEPNDAPSEWRAS